MKRRVMGMALAVLLALGLSGCTAAQTGTAALTESVTAGGSGKAQAQADVVQLELEVRAEGATTEAVRRQSAETMAAVTGYLTGTMGVDEADLQTGEIRLGEDYPSGYEMSTTLTVLLRDPDRAGEAIDGVAAAGVTGIQSVEYGVSDPQALYEQALAAAAADARESAEQMAQAAGRSLGEVLSVEEISSGAPQVLRAEDGTLADGTGVQIGETEVTASVQVTYALK